MIDFNALLLDPTYATLGVPATIVLEDGSSATTFDVTVIDKTEGVEVGNNVNVPTILPCAAIRRAELTSLGLNKDDIVNGTITFNGFTWEISNMKPKANPSGELNGELYLMLIDQTEAASSES